MTKENDIAWAHGLARLGLGVNIAIQGLLRWPDVRGLFVSRFAENPLPAAWIFANIYGIIAISETVLGVLLIFGFMLRPTLIISALLMIILVLGSGLMRNWDAAGNQMINLAFYAVLLGTASYDRFSVDGWGRKVFQQRDH